MKITKRLAKLIAIVYNNTVFTSDGVILELHNYTNNVVVEKLLFSKYKKHYDIINVSYDGTAEVDYTLVRKFNSFLNCVVRG